MKKTFLNLILTFLFTIAMVGCTNKDGTTTVDPKLSYYDPKVPFGTIANNVGLASNLLNVTADTSQLDRIILNWIVPPLYQTMDYKVMIYKKRGNDPAFVLPDPSDDSSAAPLYLRTELQGISFTDQNFHDDHGTLSVQVEQGQTYTYFFYMHVGTKWSKGVRLVATARTATDTFKFPSATKFWEYLRWSLGNPPSESNPGETVITYATMGDSGAPAPDVGSPVGGVAFAYSGNVMYYADTPNNRVIIYTRGLAYSCDQYLTTDPDLYLACTYQYASAPLVAVNILGQDSHYSKLSCSQYNLNKCNSQTSETSCNNSSSMCTWTSGTVGSCSAIQKCLNRPSKVYVADKKLFISDSGNNRIVVYNSLPVLGCDKEIIPGRPMLVDCNPSFVIGKKGLSDTMNYPISNSSLDNPTGIAVKSGNLYIADTNNNRVVMIKSYADTSQFDCTDPANWNQSLCSFSAVLGQKDFESKWSLKSGSSDGTNTTRKGLSGYDGITCSPSCTSPFVVSGSSVLLDTFNELVMSRYFRKPVEVRVTDDNRMLVAANEEISLASPLGTTQLRGRILVWDVNPMDSITRCSTTLTDPASDRADQFDNNNICMSSKIIGQSLPTKLITVSSGGRYRDSSFGLDTIDAFDLKGTLLVAVDSINNYIYQWDDFTLTPIAGTPAHSRIVNPAGRIDNSTGASRYLPNLKGISDVKMTPGNNLIFISDPKNSKVHEIRAFEYEFPQ